MSTTTTTTTSITVEPSWGVDDPNVFDAYPFASEADARAYGAARGEVFDIFYLFTGDTITGYAVTYGTD